MAALAFDQHGAPVEWASPRRPTLVVAFGLVLPGLGVALWHADVVHKLRIYGRQRRDAGLATASPARALLAGTVGWLLIVPAALQIARTARVAQRAEELCLGAARPVTGLLRVVVAAELAGLAFVVAGAPWMAPVSVWLAGVVAMAVLQPRLNAIWDAAPPKPWGWRPPAGTRVRRVPQLVSDALGGEELDATFLLYAVGAYAFTAAFVISVTGIDAWLASVDRSGVAAGNLTASLLIACAIGLSLSLGWALRELEDGGVRRRQGEIDTAAAVVAALGVALAVPWLWAVRPLFHGLLMPLWQWPLVTWIPLLLGLVSTLVFALAGAGLGVGLRFGFRAGIAWRVPVTLAIWGILMLALPSWQGRALYEASTYAAGTLPRTTQPRLLPKAAAEAYGGDASLHDVHLVVEPGSNELVWSGEREPDALTSPRSDSVAAQPLDRVDGSMQPVAGGFTPPASRVGPGSLPWRAYARHWGTRLQDAVIVPLGGSEAVAVAPYLGYRGFPVRHPYWAGVYVLHQGGQLEDLTPKQALARPELAASGRLFPERLARAIADAYGYRTGASAILTDGSRTKISDASGNPQPYLTNLGDGEVRWVTVAHRPDGGTRTAAVFLTDSTSGATEVWKPTRDLSPISNAAAVRLVERLPLKWRGCCDDNGDGYWLRKAVEPTPVFVAGHLYYLVSVVPNPLWLKTAQPVDETVVVDAERGVIAGRYDHADARADAALRAFLRG